MNIEKGIISEVYKTDNVENGVFIIPDDVRIIDEFAFSGCLFRSIVIPDSVKKIKKNAFRNCLQLCDIVMPNSVILIEYCAFWGCISLQNVILSDNIKSIAAGTFAYCKKLNKIVLPPNVQTVDKNAFYDVAKDFTLIYNENQISLANALEIEYGNRMNLIFVPYDCKIF